MENKVEEIKGDSLEGKVLVAKVGKEEEFHKKLAETIKIAQGPLGWDGHARLLMDLKAIPEFEGRTFEEIKEFLQQSALQGLYEVGEWIPEAEAEQRRKSTEVLYGDKRD